jgi:hypothetical protein
MRRSGALHRSLVGGVRAHASWGAVRPLKPHVRHGCASRAPLASGDAVASGGATLPGGGPEDRKGEEMIARRRRRSLRGGSPGHTTV